MQLDIEGKTALVTGGSAGIGLAVARALAAEGVHVAICARDRERVIARASEIVADYGVRALGIDADVSKQAGIDRVTRTLTSEMGGIDFLVNNAGTGSEEKIVSAPDEKWQYYWDLHVMAAVRLARAFVPSMEARGGGVIIHNASLCARQPLDYEPIYNVTKAALVMFSKCLANEVIGKGIRVNCINPGLVLTPDWKKTATSLGEKQGITADQYLDAIAKNNAPIGRFAAPEELADFFVFLCSPRSSYCVGSTYFVDGGWLKTIA
jgi:NAD(P)-dependent dehydrogenase (short-subunit alcohol dehydrogenase family)